MTRKKKTKAQTGPETDPAEVTLEQSGPPVEPETLPVSAPDPSGPPEIEGGATVLSVSDKEAETPPDEEPSGVIEVLETEAGETDGSEVLDNTGDAEAGEDGGAEIVSLSLEASNVLPEEPLETEIPPLEEIAETSETDEKAFPEDETCADEFVETVETSESESVAPEDEPSEPESVEFEPSNVEPGEGTESSQPSDADIQALDFQAAFRRAFQQAPEDEELEVEPLEIEQETAEIEDISGEPLARTPAQIKSAAECLLFTTPSPLGARRMANIIGGIDLRTMRGILGQLQAEYDARGSGIQIIESAEGFQMCTRPEHAAAIMQLHRQRKKNPLSPTALETLAIVAYKQPLTRAEIEMIRGVECSGVVRNLCDLDLIKVVGRKEVIGRPQLYGTTARFLQTFGLKAIEELPSIQNLRRRYALEGEEPGAATSVSDLMQRAQAARSGAVELEEPGAGEELARKPLEASHSEELGVSAPEVSSVEAEPDRPESEEAGASALGDTPMPLNRQALEKDADLEEEDGGDSSEETGDTSDPSEEDIPEEDEAEMDEPEETLIAQDEAETDEDEGWDDGKGDEDEEEDGENDEDEDEDDEWDEEDEDEEDDEDEDEEEDEDEDDD